MTDESRFACASSSLTLRGLSRKTRRVFWICLGTGVTVRLSLTEIGGLKPEQKVVKLLTTQSVKRKRRPIKPGVCPGSGSRRSTVEYAVAPYKGKPKASGKNCPCAKRG
jgi:hypothetical protein